METMIRTNTGPRKAKVPTAKAHGRSVSASGPNVNDCNRSEFPAARENKVPIDAAAATMARATVRANGGTRPAWIAMLRGCPAEAPRTAVVTPEPGVGVAPLWAGSAGFATVCRVLGTGAFGAAVRPGASSARAGAMAVVTAGQSAPAPGLIRMHLARCHTTQPFPGNRVIRCASRDGTSGLGTDLLLFVLCTVVAVVRLGARGVRVRTAGGPGHELGEILGLGDAGRLVDVHHVARFVVAAGHVAPRDIRDVQVGHHLLGRSERRGPVVVPEGDVHLEVRVAAHGL